jgi:hypothetical protein
VLKSALYFKPDIAKILAQWKIYPSTFNQ